MPIANWSRTTREDCIGTGDILKPIQAISNPHLEIGIWQLAFGNEVHSLFQVQGSRRFVA